MREPMGIGIAVVRVIRLAFDSMWVAPHQPPPAEMVAQGLKLAGKRTWWPQRVVRATVGGGVAGCGTAGVESRAPAVSPVEHVGQRDPVGWYGDGPAAHQELQCFLSPWQDLVGAALGGLQSPARCFLAKEDVYALLEAAVHECSRGGVVCCQNWSEAGHVLAELGDEVRWIH
jgi:hypothetical protein